MVTRKTELGRQGENLACVYLGRKGYKIIEKNFRKKWGEIDIIAKAPDRTLVFVEVKTMIFSEASADELLSENLLPEDQLTREKFLKLSRTAAGYAASRPDLINDKAGWQIDLIAINIKGGGEAPPQDLIEDEDFFIAHYQNIFL